MIYKLITWIEIYLVFSPTTLRGRYDVLCSFARNFQFSKS